MGDMDDERTEAVVEDKTEALKELSKGWTTLLFSVHPTVQVECERFSPKRKHLIVGTIQDTT